MGLFALVIGGLTVFFGERCAKRLGIEEAARGADCVSCACDFNDDGVVGAPDLAIIGQNFGKTVPVCTAGDCTNDGLVSESDQAKAQAEFAQTTACIP